MSRRTRNIQGCRSGAQCTMLDATDTAGMGMKDARGDDGDCGICFERALAPLRTPCCAQIFCTEHISTWINGPISNGLCPVCRAPVYLPPPPLSFSSSQSDSEGEDSTDYSFPALQHARLMQTRRHSPHPLSSVLGLRGALMSLVRALGCVAVVAVLAGGGRWGV